MVKLIVGCGYLGGRVAARWLAEGQTVFAVTPSEEHAEKFEREGLRPILADVTRSETLVNLPVAETVLWAVGYERDRGRSRQAVCVDGLLALLDALPGQTGRIIHVSSTSVYGQSDGRWVNEDSPCRPNRETGRICLATERVLADHPLSVRAIVLRLAGIYGPGRMDRKIRSTAGASVAADGQRHVNLIHVDDAAAVVLAAETRAEPPRTYLVSDGHPVRRETFYVHGAELLGLPAPQFVGPSVGEDSYDTRGGSHKRVDNARMLSELGVRLAYPSYREGLAAIFGEK